MVGVPSIPVKRKTQNLVKKLPQRLYLVVDFLYMADGKTCARHGDVSEHQKP
jgi:hypothetical protein